MKSFNQKLRSFLNIALLSTAILSFGVCEEESAEITNITGKWNGTIDHRCCDSGILFSQSNSEDRFLCNLIF